MTALVMAVLVGLAAAAVPVSVSARQRWSEAQCRALIPSLHQQAAQIVASAALVVTVEKAAHAAAERRRRVGEHRAAQDRRASRPAAVARARRKATVR